MIGRKVHTGYHGTTGTVVQWEPLGAGMTDILVEHDDGSLCWYGSGGCRPIDGRGALPSRQAAREAADHKALIQLQKIREDLISEWHYPWPGAEHGKAIIGKAIDGAIADVKERLP
jgi:hypothetical protein